MFLEKDDTELHLQKWTGPKSGKQTDANIITYLGMQQITSLTDLQRGGLVVGQSKDGHRLYFTPEDTHSLIIGATRSGKTRNLVLPSIGLTAMAGESMGNLGISEGLGIQTVAGVITTGGFLIVLLLLIFAIMPAAAGQQ